MTLKTLVTGVAAAAVMGGAAMGVTSIASPAIASADDCVDTGTLQGVVDSLVAPGGDFGQVCQQQATDPLCGGHPAYLDHRLRAHLRR